MTEQDNSPSLGGDRRPDVDQISGREPIISENYRLALKRLSIDDLLQRLDVRQARLLACDCAERVLHILYEADRIRNEELIELARRYAWSKVSTHKLEVFKAAYTANLLREPEAVSERQIFLFDAIESVRRSVRYAAVTWSEDPYQEMHFHNSVTILNRFRYGLSAETTAVRSYEIHLRFSPARHGHLIDHRYYDRYSNMTRDEAAELITPADQAQKNEVFWQKERAIEYLIERIGKEEPTS